MKEKKEKTPKEEKGKKQPFANEDKEGNNINNEQILSERSTIAYRIKAKNLKCIPGSTILSQSAKKPESRMTSFEKISMIKEGISKRDLENLKDKAGLDYHQLSKVLLVARATLINKKGDDKFDASLSEKIVGVADIYSYGYDVFEDEAKFNRWIFRSNQSLGGEAPYNLLDNQYGREEVKNLIGRIDYGVYS